MSTPVRPDVHEVAIQAAHAAELAPTGCAPTGCAWYHGIWPTLRLLGVVVHGSLAPGASGPWSARSARYAHVVARKPL